MRKTILHSRIRSGLQTSLPPVSFKLFVLVFAALFALAPAVWGQEIEWIRQFGGVYIAFDIVKAVDADGNIYIAGYTNGTFPGQTSAGGADAFVRKYDQSGAELWTRQFGTGYYEEATGISVDATGVYVAGRTNGTLPGQTSAGGETDAFVRKYDHSGAELWTRQFGTASWDYAYGISVDATGVYVVGYTTGTFPGQTSAGSADAFVRKYDPSGAELWTQQFGTASADYAYGISVDATGVYVAGYTYGTFPGQTSAGDRDAFVRKYDPSGAELWTRQFGTASLDFAYGISVDATGVYVAGYTGGTFPGQTSAGNYDAFVRKYDPSGAELWTRQFGTASYDSAPGISVDATGVYVAGYTGGTFPGQTSPGGWDAFVRKYDPSGAELWTQQFGTVDYDHAYGISVDATGVYVAGYTYGTFPGQTSAGGDDAFVRKYDDSGTELWTRQFGNPGPSEEQANAVDVDGNIYVAGYTRGTFPGQTSAGGQDAFVRTYDNSGTELWTRQFGTASFDEATGISVDATGVYLAGRTFGTLPGQTSAGGQDAFVRKYDQSGAEVWTHQFGTASSDGAYGISVDATGVYVAGYTNGTLPGQTSAGGTDAFVRKYDHGGAELWTRQFGTASGDALTGVSVDATGVYVAGYTYGTLPGQTSAGSYDAFVRTYDHSGAELWTRQFGSASYDHARGISADATGVYVAGYTYGTLPGQTSAGYLDAFVCKYDHSGAELWTHQFGTASADEAYGISVDATGVCIIGYTNGTLPGQTSAGGRDAFVRTYDHSGAELWTQQFGTAYYDEATGISVDPTGVYVAGFTVFDLEEPYGYDAFVAKISVDASDLPSFSVFAFNSVFIAQGATINSGNIGVRDASPGPWLDSQSEISVGNNVYGDDGVSIYGDTVKIKTGASVDDVHYNELDNNGTIRGDEYTPLELSLDVDLPEFPTPSPGTDDYDIPSGETLILDPGSYGEVMVRQNATLVLTGGTYHLENLDLGSNNSKVLFQEPTDVIINNRLGPGPNGFIGPDDGSGISAGDICIYVNGINGNMGNLDATPKAAEIGSDNTLFANIYAPNGTILIKEGTVAEGSFIGKDVKIGENVGVTLDSGFAVPYGEVTARISADPPCIFTGESSILSWSSTYADSATIDQWIGDVPVEGSTTVYPTETTTYTITVTGPGGTATNSVTVSVNVADIPSFSVFAFNSVWIAQGATIDSGNIGVLDASPGPWLDSQSEVSVGNNVSVDDCISLYGDTLKVKSGASVYDVHYKELDNNGTIRGDEYTPLELPLDVDLPEFPTPAPGTDDYDIPSGETLILDPGSYGEVMVRQNATLIFTGGTYHLEDLVLGYPNAKVLFQAPTDLIINNRLDPGQGAFIGPDDGSGISAGDICIYVNGINGSTGALGATPKAAEIGSDNTLIANIYAPNGTILIKEGTVAEGAFIGRDVKVGENVRVTLNSGFEEPYGEVTVSISAAPSSILLGESSTLSWSSTNADSATIDQGIGDVPVEGSTTVSPAATTTYTITATGPGGTATDSVTVTVTYLAPTVSISADPASILLGESSTLSWSSTNADSASIDQGIGDVSVSGSKTVSPAETTTYTITVTGPGGTATDSVTVTVTYPAPTVSISADPETILSGESSTISWSSTDADSATIDQGIGDVPVEGSRTVSPTETTTYTITVTGPGGTDSAAVTVTVNPISPITLEITSPLNGDIIARPDVMVQGTFNNPTGNETGITVNGVFAILSGNQFVASHVPLQEGANTITATATDTGGNTATASITVTMEMPEDYIRITADPDSGVSPLETTLRIEGTFSFTASSLTCVGTGQVEILESTAAEYRVRITGEGVYYFTAEVMDDQNNTYTDTVAIQVLNQAELDAILRAKWEAMRTALALNDIDTAVSHFDDFSKEAYREIFTALSSLLPEIAQELGDIQFIKIRRNSVEYDIRTIRDEKEYSFYLLFVRDKDGLWKIRSF